MDNKKITAIILLVIGGIVILVVGVFSGILAERQITGPKLEKAKAALQIIGSKLVPSITVFGEVKNISGRDVVLEYVGESVTVKVKNDAQIVTLLKEGGQREAKFEDLKIGDFVNVSLNITQDGEVEGSQVRIIELIKVPMPEM